GPRPEVPLYTSRYTESQRAVLAVRPGITSPATIEFSREEEMLKTQKDVSTFYFHNILPAKLAMDLHYAARITLAGDLRILARTLACLLPSGRRNAAVQPAILAPRDAFKSASGLALLKALQVALDGCVIAAALGSAYAIRFEAVPKGFELQQFL